MLITFKQFNQIFLLHLKIPIIIMNNVNNMYNSINIIVTVIVKITTF